MLSTAPPAEAATISVVLAGPVSPEQQNEVVQCALSFRRFLRHWHFKNRETGAVSAFGSCDCEPQHPWALWPGQEEFASAMEAHPWLFGLKAGKLGFTELECAFDGWVARFRQPNARIHLFSKDDDASKLLLEYVRFGLTHLPEWMQLPVMEGVAGGNNTRSLKLYASPDDERVIVSFPASPNVSIDQSATHTHVDELARMLFTEQTWTAIETTVAPTGSCHIVTRGAGDANYSATIYKKAVAGESKLYPFFASWHMRPDRDAGWYDQERREHTDIGIKQFAPRTWQEALSGGEGLRFRFDADIHVVKPFSIPDEWTRGTGTDYGFTATKVSPWWTGFLAQSPSGVVYLYDELYGAAVPAEQQAQRILNRITERGQKLHFHGADPAMWNKSDPRAPSPADDYIKAGIPLVKASNDRVNGWAMFDKLLAYRSEVGDRIVEPPRFYVFSTCREFLRTFPALPVNPHKPEDVDTDGEDDPADGCRYGVDVLLRRGTPKRRDGKFEGLDQFDKVRF